MRAVGCNGTSRMYITTRHPVFANLRHSIRVSLTQSTKKLKLARPGQQVHVLSPTRLEHTSHPSRVPQHRDMGEMQTATKHLNRLAQAKSPYLLQHAENPVSDSHNVYDSAPDYRCWVR